MAPIGVTALSRERRSRLGHDTLAHTRSGMYEYLRTERLRAAGGEIAIESLERRIKDARTRLHGGNGSE